MNHLENIERLNNEYFALRHGQSVANVAKIVVSDLENGKKEEYTLTEEGERQVKMSVSEAKLKGVLGKDTIIYASPFSRTRKTAQIAKEILEVEGDIMFDERLRERFFGDWEKTDDTAYPKVWDIDIERPDHGEQNVESTRDVLKRMTSVIKDLEEKYKDKKILLVSHGDPIKILQTGFHKISSGLHRGFNIHTAEVRKMELKQKQD